MTSERWFSAREVLPRDSEVVMTRIEDEDGIRNEQPLKRDGRMWWLADGSMYVYYTPTHWRSLGVTRG